MTAGIYQIRNLINDKIYIGSSENVEYRWKRHRRDLKRNAHHSNHLQNAWNKYGEENFVFEILEKVKDKNNLLEEEQKYIDFLFPKYNVYTTAGSSRGYLWTKEQKKKISGENNSGSKLIRGQINEIRELYKSGECTQKQLAEKFGVERETVGKIIRNERWGEEGYCFKSKDRSQYILRGERHPASKLTWKMVEEIREIYKTGKHTQRELAKRYEICRDTVKKVINNLIWKDPNYYHKINEIDLKRKLTWKHISEIREMYKTGNYTQHALAEKYNVGDPCIFKIVNYLRWNKEDK